jgi:hypothetical protein
MVRKRVRVCWVMVVCTPLVEVVGNVVASCIGCGVFKVDDDELVSATSTMNLLYGEELLLVRDHDRGEEYFRTACRCLLLAARFVMETYAQRLGPFLSCLIPRRKPCKLRSHVQPDAGQSLAPTFPTFHLALRYRQ